MQFSAVEIRGGYSMIRESFQRSVHWIPWRLRTEIKRIPVISWMQRKVIAALLEGREFVHTVDAGPAKGLVYPIVLPDDKGVWTGTYELDFVTSLADAVREGDACFDVGGWRGYCGGAMALHGAKQVVIFEPLPANCERIRRVIDLNPSLPIQLVPAAAGKSSGAAQFEIMSATSMGKLADSPFQAEATSGERITVDVVALDEWCERNHVPFPNVIKIDVEGAELMVLEGAIKILQSTKPKLFIEAHSRELAANVAAFAREFNYSVKTLETGKAPDGSSEPEVCHIVAKYES